ncbi:MAG: lamin tail domain-containing protein, partial [Candidatus Aenigmatarchaeota archaeon]
MRRFLLFALVFSLFFAPLVRAVVIQEVYPNSVKDPDGEWIKLYNQENRSIDLSNWTFSDGEYSNNQTINRTIGPEDHLLLVYNASYRNHSEEVLEYGETSSGLKLANGGDEVRLYRKDELIDEVVWEDSEENETLVFHSLEENKTEESDEEEDDDDEEEENETEEERETISSSINITEFTETVKFGGTMEISLKIFKNETRKYALYARVERKSDGWDVSEETKFYLKDRNQSYELTIPIQIKPNCDKRYEEGDYQLVVEGLGVSGSEEVKIEGWKDSVCQERIETKTEVKTVSSCEKKDFELFNYSERT